MQGPGLAIAAEVAITTDNKTKVVWSVRLGCAGKIGAPLI